ncbi:MAG: hypothetical protein JW744_02055, partial [Candidatus Diapherotrites archaeon]|nr:hypothetical protein [Candidatus Diapherotrites archaeon]
DSMPKPSKKAPRKASARKPVPAKGSVSIRGVYKRHLVPPKQRAEMLAFFGKKLADPNFFGSLKGETRVRHSDFKGIPVVIKKTGGPSHGFYFTEFRNFFAQHQDAVRKGLIKPKGYILRAPKVYGRVGDCLIMERVEAVLPRQFPGYGDPRIERVIGEIESSMSFLKEKKLIRTWPQVQDLIVAGSTNPKSPEKGRWVAFMPYDYL